MSKSAEAWQENQDNKMKEHIDYLEEEMELEKKVNETFKKGMLDYLEKYKLDAEESGYIPTVELLIEDLKKSI